MQNSLLAEINNRSVSERLLLVEDIWDHIADADDVAVTLSTEQCTELVPRPALIFGSENCHPREILSGIWFQNQHRIPDYTLGNDNLFTADTETISWTG